MDKTNRACLHTQPANNTIIKRHKKNTERIGGKKAQKTPLILLSKPCNLALSSPSYPSALAKSNWSEEESKKKKKKNPNRNSLGSIHRGILSKPQAQRLRGLHKLGMANLKDLSPVLLRILSGQRRTDWKKSG